MDAETIVTYNRELSNLSRQEGRLRRQYAKDLNELQTLQNGRGQAERQSCSESNPDLETNAGENGFELSNRVLEEIDLPDMKVPSEELATLESYLGMSADMPAFPPSMLRQAA